MSKQSVSINLHHDINIDSLFLAPTSVVKNSGFMIDNQLTFSDHVVLVAWFVCLLQYWVLDLSSLILPYIQLHKNTISAWHQSHQLQFQIISVWIGHRCQEWLPNCPCLDRVTSFVSDSIRDWDRRRQLEEESWRGDSEEKKTQAVAEKQSKRVENREAGKERQSLYG